MASPHRHISHYLATFPGVLPPADLPFTCTRDGASNALAKKQQLNRGKSSHGSGRVVLTAETERVMYRADTLDGDAVQALPCRYVQVLWRMNDDKL